MNRRNLLMLLLGLALAVGLGSTPVHGKNKVQYDRFDWKLHNTEHFEIYYYPEEGDQVGLVAAMAETAYDRISKQLDYELTLRIPILIYLSSRHFRQTNVITQFIGPGVGGFNEPIKRRIVIPLEGRRRDLQALITHELTHSFEFDMFYQFRISGEFEPVPIWIMEGLAQHTSYDWSPQDLMVLRDTVLNGYAPPLERMADWSSVPSVFAGYKLSHSAVDFLAEEYGIERFRRFLWEIRRTLRKETGIDAAFEAAFGEPLADGSRRWLRSVRGRFTALEAAKELPADYGNPILPSRYGRFSLCPTWSPGGELIAAIMPGKRKMEVVLLDPEEKLVLRTLTSGLDMNEYLSIQTEGTGLSWSHDGITLVFLGERDYGSVLFEMDVPSNRLVRRHKLDLDSPSSPTFSPDGSEVILAGYRDSQSDLFLYNLTSRSYRRITNDGFIDIHPTWSPDGSRIAYISEREGRDVLVQLDLASGAETILLRDMEELSEPAWSHSGETLYLSASGEERITNVYRLDMTDGSLTQLTDTVGGCSHPSPSPSGEELVMACYWNARQDIFRIPTDRRPIPPEDRPCPDARLVQLPEKPEPAEAAPEFGEPEQKKVPFRLLPDLVQGSVAYSSDGVFSVDGAIILSDMLGDNQLTLVGARETSRSNFLFQYLHLKRRLDFGGIFYQDAGYLYNYGSRYERIRTGGILLARYPLNFFHRVEVSVGYHKRKDDFLFATYESDVAQASVSWLSDTARYARYGATSGGRYNLEYSYPLALNDEILDFTVLRWDLRRYLPLTRRSQLSLRLAGILSDGVDADRYSIGGAGTIRGLEFGRESGSRVAWSNLELRFPLVDRMMLGGGIYLGDVRGVLFWDVGAAWDEGGAPDLLDLDDWDLDLPEDSPGGRVRSTIGAGYSLFFLGIPLHFEFAFPTDLKEMKSKAIYEFSIRYAF